MQHGTACTLQAGPLRCTPAVQAWTKCEAAGNHYLSTYAALSSSDHEGMSEDALSTQGAAAVPCCKDLAAIISPIKHPFVYAEHVMLQVNLICEQLCKERLCPGPLAVCCANGLYSIDAHVHAALRIDHGAGRDQGTPGDFQHTWA